MTTTTAVAMGEGLCELSSSQPWVLGFEDGAPLAPPAYHLNIAVVYQDAVTMKWANLAVAHVARLVGERCVRSAWWSTDQLEEPLLNLRAAQAVGLADIVVVALRCVGSLPAVFCIWIESGLDRRAAKDGALVALLGTGDEPSVAPSHAQFYLSELATARRLDFLPSQQPYPDSPTETPDENLKLAA